MLMQFTDKHTVFMILSKNKILTSIKGRNSVANFPKFKLIQAYRFNHHVMRKPDFAYMRKQS